MDQRPDPYKPPAVAASTTTSGHVPYEAVDILVATRPWLTFTIVMSALACLLMLVSVVLIAVSSRAPVPVRVGLIAGCFVGLTVNIAPLVYLRRTVVAITRLTRTSEPAALVDALRGQHRFWRYLGVLSVVCGVFSAIIVWLLVIGGLASRI